ncbi:MAG TPA: YqgQ family protein [Pseudogracilibacillus sp.]|nr:YqgQ family protein [Pseudogracilibacillus sp.]
MMENMYDVRKLLKQYGIFIYTGEPVSDIEMMKTEVQELYKFQMIDTKTYQNALLVINTEKNKSFKNNAR